MALTPTPNPNPNPDPAPHQDRVYATHFHPQEPILASCSADFTLKIWVAHLASKRGQAANPNPITLAL